MCPISMTVLYAVLGQFVSSQRHNDIQIDSVYTNSKIEQILDKHGVYRLIKYDHMHYLMLYT